MLANEESAVNVKQLERNSSKAFILKCGTLVPHRKLVIKVFNEHFCFTVEKIEYLKDGSRRKYVCMLQARYAFSEVRAWTGLVAQMPKMTNERPIAEQLI